MKTFKKKNKKPYNVKKVKKSYKLLDEVKDDLLPLLASSNYAQIRGVLSTLNYFIKRYNFLWLEEHDM